MTEPRAKKFKAMPDNTVGKAKGTRGTASGKGAKPAAPGKQRRNRRSEKTIKNILAAAEEVILLSGTDRISILDVCKEAGISRGTFYRYFASQDELLDAFARHKRERFHAELADAVAAHDDPDERFDAMIRYLDNYLEHGRSRRLLLVAPEYAFGWYQRVFHDSIVRFQEDLAIVFDAWDDRLGVSIDRELICELLIRYVLSEQLVPAGHSRKALPGRIRRLVGAMLSGRATRW